MTDARWMCMSPVRRWMLFCILVATPKAFRFITIVQMLTSKVTAAKAALL
jgi:hypothetical protein